MASKILRNISKVFSSPFQNECTGARIQRIIGNQQLKGLDPFLILDYFNVKLPAGFPDHPHRGFETVTYMLEGKMFHEDFKGNKGTLETGDVQWMTAGKGIVHAEMPGSFDQASIGFQLWVNLDKNHKMVEPCYQEYKSKMLPIIQKDGIWVRLIAGEALGEKGPIFTRTPAVYMDVRLEKNIKYEQHIPSGFQGLAFLYEGSMVVGGNKMQIQKEQAAVFEPEEGENLSVVAGEEGAKFILFAGQPIKEEVHKKSFFVMDSQQNLNDTFADIQNNRNGFEGAREWKSQIQFLSKQKEQ